ncbi:OsmC family protein [Cellulomonas sp. NPDC055163]
MGPLHTFAAEVVWTGAGTSGTTSYTAYSREHEVLIGDKPPLPGSSDPAFRGDPDRYSPEELLVAAVAQCHMLWFLHLAATAGVVVTGYRDRASGTMRVEAAGHGQFTEVVLRPRVTVAAGSAEPGTDLAELHARAHEHCFIARSVNFPVRHAPSPVHVGPPGAAVDAGAGPLPRGVPG